MAKKAKDEEPPRTKVARTKVLGQVGAAIAGKKLATEVKGLFLSEERRSSERAKTREEIARLVFEGLSKLRGTALKLAQLFCADTGLLPDECLRTFDQAHYRVPGLSPALVKSMLRRELGHDPQILFAHFDPYPTGAASLGQVHKARLRDGTPVAVKVQYPGMQESLISDLQLARLALKPMLNTGLMLSTLNQLEARLRDEVDYRRELAHMEWFRAQGLDLPLPVAVPRPFPEFSSSRVITMEWMEGETLDVWLRSTPPREQVNQVGQTVYDLFTDGVFYRRRFHSDAHLGNYLVQKGAHGALGLSLLDFGAVTGLPAEEAAFYRRLWFPEGQTDAILNDYCARGARVDGAEFWQECVQPYQEWIARFLKADEFDFSQNPAFVRSGNQLFMAQLFNPRLNGYSDQLVLVHRTLVGVFSLLDRLGAQIKTRVMRSV